MDTRFITSLVEVVETGSIAAAARNQLLTPAAISQRIKALENSIGCTLLNRAGHSAKPTADCLKILPRLKHLVKEVESLNSDLDDSGLSGELKVGAISTILTGLMPRAIKHLNSNTPNLTLQVVPGTSANLYEQLLAKKLDAIIVVTPPFDIPKYLCATAIYSEPLGVICNDNHQVDIKQLLRSKPLIQYDRAAWGGVIANTYLVNNNINTQPICELDALEAIALMVKLDMGVSLVPIWEGIEQISDKIKITPIAEQAYYRHISLISHRQIGKETLIAAFSETIYHLISP